MTAFEFRNQLVNLKDFLDYFAYHYTRNHEDAQDLSQETLLKALANYDKFRTNTNLKGWLRTLMKNIFINNYRRKSTGLIHYDSDSFIVCQGESDLFTAEDKYSHKEILKGIETLDEEYKKPFEMHVQGFKYQEISDEMNIPMGTVKSRIFHARKILAEKFQ